MDQPPAETAGKPAATDPFKFSFLDQPRPVPELHFVDGDEQAMSLADFRGRAVLLNIWATWCVPCRKEMPTLDRLQAQLGGPDFQVVTLSIDHGGVPVVRQFYAELGLKALSIYVDQSAQAATALGTIGVPTTLLIDRQGREVGRKIGPAEWDSPQVIALLREHLRLPPGADSADGSSGGR
jgi:thiol-disulfide isomerase/thioredoxin